MRNVGFIYSLIYLRDGVSLFQIIDTLEYEDMFCLRTTLFSLFGSVMHLRILWPLHCCVM